MLLFDQLEELQNQAAAKEQAVRLMDVVRHVSDNVPNVLIVFTCLRDFYKEMRRYLSKSVLDRLERDPDVMELVEQRSDEDTKALVGRRLEYLYEQCGVRFREDAPCFPLPQALIDSQRGVRARDLFKHLQRYQQDCVAQGVLLPWTGSDTVVAVTTPQPERTDTWTLD